MSKHTLSEAEFARCFQEHSRALWCVAVAVLGSRSEADDVLQESAIIGLQKRADFTSGSSFVHWMSQIVRYTALNAGRRRRRHVGLDFESHPEPQDRSRTSAPLEVVEPFDDRLLAALATLDETARVCLLMRTVLELPYRQIAEALEIAEGTAMSHVHRSRHRLRTALLSAQRFTPAAGANKTGGA
jgi:RNA polymerase sigma-70 factor, ECF subfamily